MKQHLERRHFWRSVFHSPVLLRHDGGEQQARLLDLSLKGALLQVGPLWQGAMAQPCELQLDLGTDVQISMRGAIAFVDGTHVGLRCDNIDLESIIHLRRLLELNAGTEYSLDRDLANLLA